jgi:WD40 repeat protein
VRLVGHAGAITCIAIAHSDTWVVSGGEDAKLRIWNVTSALTQCSSDPMTGESNGSETISPCSLCVSILTGHTRHITGVVITPSDR